MAFLYDIAIRIYYLVILIVSPFNPKARLWLKGRRHLFEQLQAEIKVNEPIIWFHASSLGEFEQGRPVIEAFKKQKPEYKILLTFFSPRVMKLEKNIRMQIISVIFHSIQGKMRVSLSIWLIHNGLFLLNTISGSISLTYCQEKE